MLAFGMEGVGYSGETVWISEPLIEVGASLPGIRSLYLILLQSALHRHGVEFYDRDFIKRRPAVRINCSIRYVEEENAVLLQTERRTERIPQPDPEKLSLSPYGENEEQSDVSEEDFFALDQIAMREAARIYRVLSQNGSFSPDIGRQEATA